MVLVKNSRDRQKNMIERIHIRTGTMFHNSVCVLFNESLRFSPTFLLQNNVGIKVGQCLDFQGLLQIPTKPFLLALPEHTQRTLTSQAGYARDVLSLFYIFIEYKSDSKVNTHTNQVTVEQIEAEAFQREPDSF